jgi:hypothetical protein
VEAKEEPRLAQEHQGKAITAAQVRIQLIGPVAVVVVRAAQAAQAMAQRTWVVRVVLDYLVVFQAQILLMVAVAAAVLLKVLVVLAVQASAERAPITLMLHQAPLIEAVEVALGVGPSMVRTSRAAPVDLVSSSFAIWDQLAQPT